MRRSPTPYIAASLLVVPLALFVACAAYLGGYFLLANDKGLYSSRSQFDFYEPAFRVQRWITNRPVRTGYVDEHGIQNQRSLR